MKGRGHFDESDPEPVLVTLGEPEWDRRARCADILIGELIGEMGGVDCIRGTRDVLFLSHPGLSLIALVVPPDLIFIADRSGSILWHTCPARSCSYPLDAVAAIATSIYFQGALPHGRLGGVLVDTRPQP